MDTILRPSLADIFMYKNPYNYTTNNTNNTKKIPWGAKDYTYKEDTYKQYKEDTMGAKDYDYPLVYTQKKSHYIKISI